MTVRYRFLARGEKTGKFSVTDEKVKISGSGIQFNPVILSFRNKRPSGGRLRLRRIICQTYSRIAQWVCKWVDLT
ncbi:MAG: hypothetical protein PHG64_14755 [Paludibacter sp.]|nr:hypothetical protein [Paludibacter sp.]